MFKEMKSLNESEIRDLVFCVITLYLSLPHLLSSANVPHISGSGHA